MRKPTLQIRKGESKYAQLLFIYESYQEGLSVLVRSTLRHEFNIIVSSTEYLTMKFTMSISKSYIRLYVDRASFKKFDSNTFIKYYRQYSKKDRIIMLQILAKQLEI